MIRNQVPELQSYHEARGRQQQQHVAARQGSESDGSERELFAIFSGLRVVTMAGTPRVGQATYTTFEDEGTAH